MCQFVPRATLDAMGHPPSRLFLPRFWSYAWWHVLCLPSFGRMGLGLTVRRIRCLAAVLTTAASVWACSLDSGQIGGGHCLNPHPLPPSCNGDMSGAGTSTGGPREIVHGAGAGARGQWAA